MKTWLKYGLIVGIIFIIPIVLAWIGIIADTISPMGEGGMLILFLLIPSFIFLQNIYETHMGNIITGPLLSLIFNFVMGFVIGAVIGLIVGAIRRKE